MLLENEKINFAELKKQGHIMTEDEINKKYRAGELRIVTEQGKYPLNNIIDILNKNINFHPDYQRRRVWTQIQKSRLIESFIINVPVPPIFLYEVDFNSYEVMDGLQRLSTLFEFYSNNLTLKGLEVWPELNGNSYEDLPMNIRNGINRRYLSTIVILNETAKNKEQEDMLKTFVFERLNTGGTKLTQQETRNALYDGPMNNLCKELSENCKVLHKLWHMERVKPLKLLDEENFDEYIEKRKRFKSYIRMEDVELVLRFYAYRQLEEIPATKVSDILDIYLRESNKQYNDSDKSIITKLKNLYYKVLNLTDSIFGDSAFYMYTKSKSDNYKWNKRPSKLVYDPLLIVISEYIDKPNACEMLIKKKNEIKSLIENMFIEHHADFNGRNNNKSDVLRRKELYKEVFQSILESN